jgi:hypothetical protein
VFLNMLESDEKKAFAELASRMIEADGIVVGREAAALAALKAEMGVADATDERSADELAAVFSTRRSKVVALLELIGLGYSDTAFSVTEQSLVTEVATAMGVTEGELSRLQSWVQEHVDLVQRALVFMRD